MKLPKLRELFDVSSLAEAPKSFTEWFFSHELPWEPLGKGLKVALQNAIHEVPSNQRLRGDISPQAFIDESQGVVVEEGAIVEPFAYIQGPTFIESGATVRHGAYIRGGSFIASGAIVGHSTEVKDSILMHGAKAAHFAYVGNSILGAGCNLGAGTKLANFRFDGKNIILRDDGKRLDSGLRKFGAILGDRAQTGCNSVTNPGTIFSKESVIKPNSTALGFVPNRTNS